MDQQQSGQQGARQQPLYDISNGGHYGASAALSAQGYIPHTELYSGLWSNINQGLTGAARDILATYWQQTINHLETDTHDFKIHQLPLARIKKVMKADPEVKMISAEAPILFAKGCDIFITELTMRAWIHAEDNKRRTLQRSDIAAALAKSDMFDFLIDIVPREEPAGGAKRPTTSGGGTQQSQPQATQQPTQQQQQQPQMSAQDYGMQHGGMAPPDQQYARQNMYAGAQMGSDGQHDPNQYGQPAQMFAGQDMYNPYTQGGFPGSQQMYLAGQRPPSQGYAGRPGTAGNE
ncbi:Transcriptional activator HAP5 [Cyphellophora attinorum]|uniref:Transcriptional activator HAP5 n=1 Tax=Cyphellophora attinorum TaxID=1664694 RepID=A0A0N1HSK4_9EURO|nr:Transcriptional activator HAP5 [Phialophora attinorum]KPI41627.1 Transcriptional activator HAP5 [Phialophora attinorum]